MAEHRFCKPTVVGSTPTLGSIVPRLNAAHRASVQVLRRGRSRRRMAADGSLPEKRIIPRVATVAVLPGSRVARGAPCEPQCIPSAHAPRAYQNRRAIYRSLPARPMEPRSECRPALRSHRSRRWRDIDRLARPTRQCSEPPCFRAILTRRHIATELRTRLRGGRGG